MIALSGSGTLPISIPGWDKFNRQGRLCFICSGSVFCYSLSLDTGHRTLSRSTQLSNLSFTSQLSTLLSFLKVNLFSTLGFSHPSSTQEGKRMTNFHCQSPKGLKHLVLVHLPWSAFRVTWKTAPFKLLSSERLEDESYLIQHRTCCCIDSHLLNLLGFWY